MKTLKQPPPLFGREWVRVGEHWENSGDSWHAYTDRTGIFLSLGGHEYFATTRKSLAHGVAGLEQAVIADRDLLNKFTGREA